MVSSSISLGELTRISRPSGNAAMMIQNKKLGGTKMTKAELIGAVAEQTGFSKKDSDKAVNAVLDTITAELAQGEKIQLVGFGTFEVRERAARDGINPLTKAPMQIPASKVPAFKAGKALKDAVSK